MLLDAQLRHDLGPALGDGLLDDCRRVDPGLHHLQHILHRQRRVDPLGDNGGQLALHQLLVQLRQCGPGRAARRQRQAAPGELFEALVARPTLAADQHQGNVADHRSAAADALHAGQWKQLPGCNQIPFAALQRSEQLILSLGNDLEGDGLSGCGVAVQVLFEGAQAGVLHADRLALDLTGAVAALVDQHPQYAAAADFGEITYLVARLPGLRSGHAGACRERQRTQQQTEQKWQQS